MHAFRFTALSIGAFVVLSLGLGNACAAATLPEVIENLHSHEALYHDIEIELVCDYVLHPGAIKKDDSAKSVTRTRRLVLQDGKHYFQANDHLSPVKGADGKFNVTVGYDGEVTRKMELQDISSGVNARHGHIIHGLAFDHRVTPPHSILLDDLAVNFPLSTLLSGSSSIRTDQRAQEWMHASSHVDVVSHHTTELQGLHCVQLTFYRYGDGETREIGERHNLWLATERNYFPVRHEASLESRYGTDRPYAIGECGEFLELAPGIWFPKKVSINLYNLLATPPTLQATIVWTTETAELSPTYDSSLFEDIPFPGGSIVDEVRNGKIERSFRIPESSAMVTTRNGEIERSFKIPESSSKVTTWSALVVLGIVVVVGLLVVQSRRKKPT